jgi:DNA invertase Pin-like site-specific DNA recombinase
MKVALYARVSTADQHAETQLAALRRYCEVLTWTVGAEYVDISSGATALRPELGKLMEPANLRTFDAVLVWKFDRMFRSVTHMVEVLDRFRTMGVDFVSATECIDTSTPAGRMVYHMLAAVGQFERDLIVERTREGIRNARARGKQIGRPPAAFDVDEAVRLWNHGNGLSYRGIAKRFAEQGVKVSASKVFTALQEAVLKRTETVSERGSTGTPACARPAQP